MTGLGSMVTERDDHKMSPLFTGKMTPEIAQKKEEAHKRAMELRKKMNRAYAEKKMALV